MTTNAIQSDNWRITGQSLSWINGELVLRLAVSPIDRPKFLDELRGKTVALALDAGRTAYEAHSYYAEFTAMVKAATARKELLDEQYRRLEEIRQGWSKCSQPPTFIDEARTILEDRPATIRKLKADEDEARAKIAELEEQVREWWKPLHEAHNRLMEEAKRIALRKLAEIEAGCREKADEALREYVQSASELVDELALHTAALLKERGHELQSAIAATVPDVSAFAPVQRTVVTQKVQVYDPYPLTRVG